MPGCYCPRCTVELSPTAAACAACGFPRPGIGWPQDPVVGKTINDRYRVTGRIGAGGFGVVYRALQRRGNIDLGEVVLKFLQPGLANQPEIRRRFVNEARAARRVHSPHVVTIFDLDFDHDGMPFMVMELLRGESLKQVLAVEGRLPPFRVCRIGIQAAGALEACHRAGVVHRDLKPSNLLLLEGHATDFVKIIDFGIARVPNPEESLTTQAMLGTPRYMAPEQVRQEPIDYRADLFALGVLLYVALAGEPPIPAQGAIECMQRNLDTSPIPLRVRCPELPPDLEQLLAEMMAKDRARRPASMTAVGQELRRIGVASGWVREDSLPMAVADSSTSRSLTLSPLAGAGRRRSPALLAALAVAVIGLPFAGGLLWSRNRASPPSTDARVAATPPDAGSRASGERKDLARAERPSARERADARVEPQRTPGERKKKTHSKGARKGKKKGKDTLIYDEL